MKKSLYKYPLTVSIDDEHKTMLEELAFLHGQGRSAYLCELLGREYVKEVSGDEAVRSRDT